MGLKSADRCDQYQVQHGPRHVKTHLITRAVVATGTWLSTIEPGRDRHDYRYQESLNYMPESGLEKIDYPIIRDK